MIGMPARGWPSSRSRRVVSDGLRGLAEQRLGLAVELFAPAREGRGVVVEELLLLEPRVDRVAADRERATRLRPELAFEPIRVAIERRGRLVRGGTERTQDRARERRAAREQVVDTVAEERGSGGDRP